MYSDRDTLSNVPRWGYITARDQSMVESCVTEGRENNASFFFLDNFVKEHNNTNTKPQVKQQRFLKLFQKSRVIPEQLVEKKDTDNIRKVLRKTFIQ